MPIIELQRKLREIGRIRIGNAVDTGRVFEKGAKKGQPIKRPSKLSTFRLTSQDESIVQAAAAAFGGTCLPWADAPAGRQWEVITEASCLNVIVPPGGMAFSQWYETWSGGGCLKRCDGKWDTVNDQACSCNPEERECKMHTRLSVILRDLPGLGVWRLDTSGYYAGVELGGVVEVCEKASERGQMLAARLLLQEREVKRIVNGKAETRKFGVPNLDVDLSFAQLLAGPQSTNGHALPPFDPETGEVSFSPVPVNSLPPGPQPSVAEQVRAAATPTTRPARKNAQTPIPATAAKVRTAAQVAGSGTVDIRIADAVLTITQRCRSLDPAQLATYREEAESHGWPKVSQVSRWTPETCLAVLALLDEIDPPPTSPRPDDGGTPAGVGDNDPTGVEPVTVGGDTQSPSGEPDGVDTPGLPPNRARDPLAPSTFHARGGAMGIEEEERRRIVGEVTQGRTTSVTECGLPERQMLKERLDEIAANTEAAS